MKFSWQDRRKAVRDRYREKFWADLNIKPIKDVKVLQEDVSPFIGAALSRLIEPNDLLFNDDLTFLRDVQAQLSGLALGVPCGFTTPSAFGSKSHSFNAVFDGWFRINEARSGTCVRIGSGWTGGTG